LTGDAQAWPTLAGMLLATAGLHGAGMTLGWALRHANVWMPRAAGVGVALFGLALLTRLA
ncbi:MAG: HupE/UreJ family protein, partial [Ramlibacter sp.]|nr:HupE/UreJ family protein [Ramlibacter sp.]